jgi:glucosamine-6-phosphate deaminase
MTTIVCTPDVWANQVATEFNRRMKAFPAARICLPSGTTPAPVYSHINRGALARADVIMLDEFGGLQPNDPARCFNMLQRDLLNRVVPLSLTCPDVDDPDPLKATERFAAQLNERPIDLAIVGVGTNGHIGMNEPGAPLDTAAYLAALAPSTTQGTKKYGALSESIWGITIGLGALLNAAEVWVLATGETKREILKKAFAVPASNQVPVSLLREHPNCTFWLDSNAEG